MEKNKRFDAVKMMRDIRDKLSAQLKDLPYEEEKRFIGEHLKVKLAVAPKAKRNQECA